MKEDEALDRRLVEAHATEDKAALARLYAEAAELAERYDADRTAFYLTHAYIFALDAGLPEARTLKDRLVAMGRETET